MIRVAQSYAKKNKFDLLLVRGVAVYMNSAKLDITNKVIEQLKREFKSRTRSEGIDSFDLYGR